MKRKELLSILESVKPGIASKDINENMTYFMFSGKDIITYNDQISIQHPLKTDFSLFVKANDLYKIISKTSVSDITLSEGDGKLNVKCNKLNASLATINDDEILERISNVSKSLDNAKWKSLPDNFSSMISLCKFVASTQESDKTLTCVKIYDTNVVASDNKRIAHAILNSSIDDMFIKASEIKNLVAINPVEYAVQNSWLHFKNEEGCIFSLRKISGNFPDFLGFFDFEGKEIHLPKEIIEGMNVASIFADESNPAVNLNITKGYVFISIESDAGKIKHRSKIDYVGEDIKFSINPEFLKQMMEHSSSIIITEEKVKLKTDDKSFSMVSALYNN